MPLPALAVAPALRSGTTGQTFLVGMLLTNLLSLVGFLIFYQLCGKNWQAVCRAGSASPHLLADSFFSIPIRNLFSVSFVGLPMPSGTDRCAGSPHWHFCCLYVKPSISDPCSLAWHLGNGSGHVSTASPSVSGAGIRTLFL